MYAADDKYRNIRYTPVNSIDEFRLRRDRLEFKNIRIKSVGGREISLHGIEECPWLENLWIDYEVERYGMGESDDESDDESDVESDDEIDVEIDETVERDVNIHGIEYCASLESLIIIAPKNGKNNKIDLTPLAHLTSLRWMILKYLNVSSLAGISIPLLKELMIHNCTGISDLRILNKLQLKVLDCRYCDLESLDGLDTSILTSLHANGNRLTRFEELRGARNLKTLTLCRNNIICLDPIREMITKGSLQNLDVHESYCGDDPLLRILIEEGCYGGCFNDVFNSTRLISDNDDVEVGVGDSDDDEI